MNKKVLHSIFSIVLMVIILLPFTIQTTHVLHGHNFDICTAKDVKHIDQHQTDCSNYHQIIEQNAIDFLPKINLEISTFYKYHAILFHKNQHRIFLQQKSSRAPPYFIV